MVAGVPQGSDLAPDLYNIFTADIPRTCDTLLATFADNTTILSTDKDTITAAHHLQHHANLIEAWSENLTVKVNESKSTRVTFSLRRDVL